MLGRPIQLSFEPSPKGWDEIAVPQPATAGATTAQMYAKQWSSIAEAAQELGWSPADVASAGTEAFAAELRRSGLRNWSHNTVVRYAKLLRYAGVDQYRHPSPTAYTASRQYDPTILWQGGIRPITNRNSLLALFTWHWPVDLTTLHDLQIRDVQARADGSVVISRQASIPRASGLWDDWKHYLSQVDADHVWATTQTGPTRRKPGTRLSTRGLQYAFRNHAHACGLDLTWRDYQAAAPPQDLAL